MRRAPLPTILASLLLSACGPGSAGSDTSDSSCQTGEPLPAVGSPCAEEGATCLLSDACEPAPARVCQSGTWQETTATPPGCDTSSGTSGGSSSTTDPTGGSGSATGSSGGMTVPCGTELPPEGSACAMEGEDCAPDADPCLPYTGARCEGGMWSYYEVGPGDPMTCQDSCDPFPMEGAACMTEGKSCTSGCEDQCQFCNIIKCEGGVWVHLEAPPAPCLSCDELCPFVVEAMCPNGPPDVAACLPGCADSLAQCPTEFSAVRACAGLAPKFSCDMDGRPVVAGCEGAFADLYTCLGA